MKKRKTMSTMVIIGVVGGLILTALMIAILHPTIFKLNLMVDFAMKAVTGDKCKLSEDVDLIEFLKCIMSILRG